MQLRLGIVLLLAFDGRVQTLAFKVHGLGFRGFGSRGLGFRDLSLGRAIQEARFIFCMSGFELCRLTSMASCKLLTRSP